MKPTITIFGNFQNGKSTLVNCLLKSDMAKVGGVGLSVTRNNTRYVYANDLRYAIRKSDGSESIIIDEWELDSLGCRDEVIIYIPNRLLQVFDLVDTPGYNVSEHDNSVADSIIKHTDFAILLVHNKGLSVNEKEIARKLSSADIPFIVVMNCYNDIFEQWIPSHRSNDIIAETIKSELKFDDSSFVQNGIFVTNLMWYWLSLEGSKESVKANKSIGRCSKLLCNYWDDFSTDVFSVDNIAKISQFKALFNYLNSSKFRRYIQGIKLLNNAFFDYGDLIENYLYKQKKEKINKELSQMQEDYRKSHNWFANKKEKEIKDYLEKRERSKNKGERSKTFLGVCIDIIASSIQQYFNPVNGMREEIARSKNETEHAIKFLEQLKIK